MDRVGVNNWGMAIVPETLNHRANAMISLWKAFSSRQDETANSSTREATKPWLPENTPSVITTEQSVLEDVGHFSRRSIHLGPGY